MSFEIILFSITVITIVFVGYKMKIPYVSCFYSFNAFTLLYCIAIYVGYIYGSDELSLSSAFEVGKGVIYSGLMGSIAFSVSYAYFTKRSRCISFEKNPYRYKYLLFDLGIFLSVYLLLFFILIVFSKKYGWHAVSRDGLENIGTSIYAYVKYIFIILGILILWTRPLVLKWIIFILLTQTIVMLLDGGRTTYFGLILAYFWILSKNNIKPSLVHFLYIFAFIVIMLITRSLAIGGGLLEGMWTSVFVEGIFGGYTAMQSMDYVTNQTNKYLFGGTYLFDPIIYIAPKDLRSEYLLFQNHMANYLGTEDFAPLGGFFWISEAIINFGIYGSLLVGGVYGYILSKVEYTSVKNHLYSMLFIASLGAILSKVYFAGGVKIMIFYLVSGFIFKKTLFYKRKCT